MFPIFLRIYTGLVFTLVLIFSLVYVSIQKINDHRYYEHVARWVYGPATLVAAGWQGDTHSKTEWLHVINEIGGLKWQVTNTIAAELKPNRVYNNLYIKADWKKHYARIWLRLNTDEKADSNRYLTTELNDLHESLSETLGILVLRELKNRPKSELRAEYKRLSAVFNVPLTLIRREDMKFDFISYKTLNTGLPAIVRTHDLNNSFYTVYIPTPEPEHLLQLGPLPMFHWISTAVVVPAIVAVLVLVALAVFIFISPLHTRFSKIVKAIDKIEDKPESINVPLDGNDCFSDMAFRINNVAHRLVRSLEKNRELNQAVSHELKTPLARMRFRVELLGKRGINQKDLSKSIGSDLRQLEDLVNELLYFHKIDNQTDEGLIEFDLFPIINDVIEEVSLTTAAVSFHTYISQGMKMRGRLPEIRRLVKNVIENACKYGNGKVQVSTIPNPHMMVLIVEDNGKGIPIKERERMLQPFTRLEGSRNKSTGGTGLGLAICHRIVQSHHGTLTIERSWLGGCRIRMAIPK